MKKNISDKVIPQNLEVDIDGLQYSFDFAFDAFYNLVIDRNYLRLAGVATRLFSIKGKILEAGEEIKDINELEGDLLIANNVEERMTQFKIGVPEKENKYGIDAIVKTMDYIVLAVKTAKEAALDGWQDEDAEEYHKATGYLVKAMLLYEEIEKQAKDLTAREWEILLRYLYASVLNVIKY